MVYTRFKIRIYPSHVTRAQHVNSDPLMVSLVIVSVFLFTSMIFVCYTIAVAQRQRVVMDRAVASSAIVSSLFPSQVRDQIYQENEMEARKRSVDNESHLLGEATDTTVGASRPIAEVFESTTIIFADIVGFTAWSSSRSPVNVFELLETLYKAFDTLALRRGVFKVETIGDCYVAATGLPTPQDDHAVIMVRFADDCMRRMRQLTAELTSSLGDDTAQLDMRIGLHSGPVTGGVLRGQKSRFQLFGDTMNTASRIESNGEAGRIHISQQTADELISKGKSNWITSRQDKVVAKGKGELQTYWAEPRAVAEGIVKSNNGVPRVETASSVGKSDAFEI
jgi:class 3 adenylate cyclase